MRDHQQVASPAGQFGLEQPRIECTESGPVNEKEGVRETFR